MTISEEMKAQGWIEHDGGPCPVHRFDKVGYLMRGHEAPAVAKHAGTLDWVHVGEPWDIIAYKPETPNA